MASRACDSVINVLFKITIKVRFAAKVPHVYSTFLHTVFFKMYTQGSRLIKSIHGRHFSVVLPACEESSGCAFGVGLLPGVCQASSGFTVALTPCFPPLLLQHESSINAVKRT